MNPKYFVLFLGWGKSGGTLIGSIIDAHPNAIISNEYDILSKFHLMSKQELFDAIIETSNKQASRERMGGYGYKYAIPGQGKAKELFILGDKKAGKNTKILGHDLQPIADLANLINTSIKFINVVRNPFDIIAAIVKAKTARWPQTIDESIAAHTALCEKLSYQRNNLDDLLTIRLEDVISDKEKSIQNICEFLELDASESYISDCCKLIYTKPSEPRKEVSWNNAQISEVQIMIQKYDFLRGYELT